MTGVAFLNKAIQKTIPYILVFPAILILAIFSYAPIPYGLILALSEMELGTGNRIFAGLENFRKLINDVDFWESFNNTVYYSVGATIGLILLGLLLAIMLNRKVKFNAVYLTVLFIPWVLSDVISGITWKWMFNEQYSILDFILKPLGFRPSQLMVSSWGAMLVVIIVHIWRNLSFSVILLMAALQNIPDQLYEAAKIDGATGWDAFIHVTLPMIMPTLLTTTLLILVGAINQTGMILVLTNGGPVRATETLGVFMYREAFLNYHLNGAATLSVILAIINGIVAAIYFGAMNLQRRKNG